MTTTDDFPDKIGRDKANNIRVRFRGEVQRPMFNSYGAAEAFLDGLQQGVRTPEPEELPLEKHCSHPECYKPDLPF